MLNHAVVRQAARFAVVGSIATGVHYAILIALVEIGHVKPLVATTFGYCFGVITSYALNRRFTFRDTAAPVASSFLKFVLLYGIGAVLNGTIMSTVMHLGAPYILAQVAATGLVMIWNFLGARFVVFR